MVLMVVFESCLDLLEVVQCDSEGFAAAEVIQE